MRVVIAGGGTGGHLFPGLALADELVKRDPSVEILFIGTDRGIEARVVPREGYNIRFVSGAALVGKSLSGKLKALFSFIKGLRESYRILKETEPQIVVGTGGYVSVAPVVAAWLQSIPVLIMEQNTVPGKANRFLARMANAICITYQESMAFFPRDKVHLTGNPVRDRVTKGSPEAARRLFSLKEDLFTVLVFGGSRGASSINRAMVEALPYLTGIKEEVQFLHQTGESDYRFVRGAYQDMGFKGTVTPFIYQMPEAYAVADLVISRAGATALAEICVTGKPSILVPYPYAAEDHQRANAEKLMQMGAAVMILDKELNGKRLSEEILRLFNDPQKREEMKRKALGFGRPEAARKIADIVGSIASLKQESVRCLKTTG
ncbi:MAG: undecaprenyldiphospho-muramoylpentapeptide beta-N-acetylglucosaminyltransferase [Nitrospirae bacterium]|nr:undecaprenyldiphospho-muramoylpentapeptide beta-N-acetylglucosaminyltransferase [Nitrospirota bacterium]